MLEQQIQTAIKKMRTGEKVLDDDALELLEQPNKDDDSEE